MFFQELQKAKFIHDELKTGDYPFIGNSGMPIAAAIANDRQSKSNAQSRPHSPTMTNGLGINITGQTNGPRRFANLRAIHSSRPHSVGKSPANPWRCGFRTNGRLMTRLTLDE